MKYKAVCSDIDGTLLNGNRELSPVTIDTFRNLPEAVPVILASSRMPSAMTHLQAELGITGHPMICYNGGYLIQHKNGSHKEVIDSVTIPFGICEGIIRLADNTSIHISLYNNDEWFAPRWDYWAEREAAVTKVNPIILPLPEVMNLWSENNTGAHKVMCMGPATEIEAVERLLYQKFGGVIHIYRSRDTYLELAPKVISKGSALQLLLNKKYSIDMSEVISFGDNYNDIELIRMSGLGVAVANAREEVRSVAAEVTLDSKLDGVAVALRKYFQL